MEGTSKVKCMLVTAGNKLEVCGSAPESGFKYDLLNISSFFLFFTFNSR